MNQIVRWEDYVEEQKFDYVVLAARWAWLFEGNYGGRNIGRFLLIAHNNPTFTIEASKQTFIAQLEYTVSKIKESGAEPITIGPVPNHGKGLEGCDNVPTYVIGDRQIEARCNTVAKHLALERVSWTNEAILDQAHRHGVSAVIPTDYFCDTDHGHCRLFFEGSRLSNDGSHINGFGSIYLAKRWEADTGFPFADNAMQAQP